MRNLKLTLAYRGTAYHGFQVQENAVTVCSAFQDGVEKALGQRYDVRGCSRTDAGVHANGFVLSLFLPDGFTIPPDAVVRALNVSLPMDIAVLSCQEVPQEFHPRYDCTGKRYLYKIWNAPVKSPFLEDLALHYRYPIDLSLANQAAAQFVGTYDFSALCAAGDKVLDHTRTVYDCHLEAQGPLITLSVTGDGFLYNMVRILTGTVLEVCAHKKSWEELVPILLSRNRGRAGPTAPAHGLYLDEVFYEVPLQSVKFDNNNT